MVSDHDRRELYVALEGALGTQQADRLMDLLPPVGWADVARKSDIDVLNGRVDALGAELKGEIAELRGEIKAQLPKLYVANIGTAIGVAGLVLAAAKLA
jgi:hypothetical protein